MSKKRIHSRLETLFTDLANEEYNPSQAETDTSQFINGVEYLLDEGNVEAGINQQVDSTSPVVFPIRPKNHSGNGKNKTAQNVITTIGKQGSKINEITIKSATSDSPAEIAIPIHLQGLGDLLLEIVDEGQGREWSEEDRLLVSEVTDQLALALDNAQLYESVQQELSERIRAERAILRRNKDLATLNQIGQQLSNLSSRGEIFELLSHMIGEVLDNRNLIICTFSDETRQLTFPIYHVNGQQIDIPARQIGTGIPDFVIRNRTPLLITHQAAEELRDKEINLHGEIPASLIAIPMITGDAPIGAIVIQDFEKEYSFDSLHVELLSTAASQAATAVENAQAYELSQKAIEDMKEIDRVKSQFLANMSHELRTPLNSIIGFSRVIVKEIDGPINDLQKQDLTAIYNSGQHLLSLINDILDLSKIEAGKMELSFSQVNLVDMINSALSTAAGLVKDKPIQIRSLIPDSLPLVRADTTRLRQVLINFLSNAAKFTDLGTITVEAVRILGPDGRQEVMVTVTDTGSGIAAEDQSKLFMPFSQVDDSPTRKTGGTGLGLSICRSLIELHDGRIGLLHSELGVGSTFYFALPLAQADQETSGSSNEPEKGQNIVLAIDDDLNVIHLYERYLKPHGYKVVPLTNPNRAVEQVIELRPFAITLDINMPGKDGWQVLQELKSLPATRDVPIIVCSILEKQEKGFSLGASDYLVKPFLQEDLINTLSRLNKDGRIRNILVIDDDPEDVRLVQKMLESVQQYHILTANGGPQGWNALQANQPDAVILDLFMPELNGFHILNNMREDPALRHIPVLILTGADLSPEQHLHLTTFGQAVLAKGYLHEKELLVLLEEALRQFKTPQPLTNP